LVARSAGGKLGPKWQKSWDVHATDGTLLQVKARALTPENPSRQLSPIRSWDFDQLVVVLFDENYSVLKAVFLDRELAWAHATWREHVDGWILHERDGLLASGVDRTTDVLQLAL
jgi:hypothetical protein